MARCIILSFPYTPDTLAIATWVAAEEGDPAAASQFIADFQGQGMDLGFFGLGFVRGSGFRV